MPTPILEYQSPAPVRINYRHIAWVFAPVLTAAIVSITLSCASLAYARHHETLALWLTPHAQLYQNLIEFYPGYLSAAGAVVSAVALIIAVARKKLPIVALLLLWVHLSMFVVATFFIVLNAEDAFP